MSGGHFNYDQDRIQNIIDEIENMIVINNTKNEFGFAYEFKQETLDKFKLAIKILTDAQEMAQRIDWLVSGDDGEESFHKRWNEFFENERTRYE